MTEHASVHFQHVLAAFPQLFKVFFQHGSALIQESEEGGKEEGGLEGEFFFFLPDCF